jgi:GH15 family glucan-1,4-alpha-glucosidase
VNSKLMSWVALERAGRISRRRGLPAGEGRWTAERDAIYEEVMEKGWNPRKQSFVQHYGSDALDASLLLMPLVKMVGPTDPRWLATLERIRKELAYDVLVDRYRVAEAAPDGLSGEEGSFSMCSFWLVECLTRAGRLEEARLALEKMFSYANHLGLYAEEIGPSGEALGNFPQAFTHLALISAAVHLDRALGAR